MATSTFNHLFDSSLDDVAEATKKAMAWLRHQGIDTELAGRTELVLAEALNNVVEHGYQFKKTGDVELQIAFCSSEVDITIRDQGRELGQIPCKKDMDRGELALDELPEGGFGWFLIHEMTSKIEYKHSRGKNILSLRLSAEHPSFAQ